MFIDGKLYGDGVYFATQFSYSAQEDYAQPDPNGIRCIFRCRVLTGEYTQGAEGLKEPPPKLGNRLYDSVVDDMNSPTMYVVFKDNHAYPEYLIKFA